MYIFEFISFYFFVSCFIVTHFYWNIKTFIKKEKEKKDYKAKSFIVENRIENRQKYYI